jgi:DNA modification methylase
MVLNGPLFLCTRWDVAGEWRKQIESAGLKVKNTIAWIKSNHSMGDLYGAYGSKWEAILFAHGGTFKFPNQRPVDVWDLGQIFTSGHRHHPTEKTIRVPEKAIEDTTASGATVLDLFGGSGSTLIACEKTKRKCFMMELDPHYIDVIVTRWCKFTGRTDIKRNGEAVDWIADEQV